MNHRHNWIYANNNRWRCAVCDEETTSAPVEERPTPQASGNESFKPFFAEVEKLSNEQLDEIINKPEGNEPISQAAREAAKLEVYEIGVVGKGRYPIGLHVQRILSEKDAEIQRALDLASKHCPGLDAFKNIVPTVEFLIERWKTCLDFWTLVEQENKEKDAEIARLREEKILAESFLKKDLWSEFQSIRLDHDRLSEELREVRHLHGLTIIAQGEAVSRADKAEEELREAREEIAKLKLEYKELKEDWEEPKE